MIYHNNVFDYEFCDYLVDYVKTNCPISGVRDINNWWMYPIWGTDLISKDSVIPNNGIGFFDDYIKDIILDKLRNNFDVDNYDLNWMQMTEYSILTNGLWVHLDSKRNKTISVLLSDGFVGGETSMDGKIIDFKKGDGYIFDGYRIPHGVNPVTSGTRYCLNLWLTEMKKNLI